MSLFYKRVVVESEGSPGETLRRLEGQVGARPRGLLGALSREPRAFEGVVSGDGFSVQRVVTYYGSRPLPLMRGVVEASGRGSRVVVEFSLGTGTKVFMGAWLGFAGFMAVVGGIAVLTQGRRLLFFFLIAVGLPVFGFTLWNLGFWWEVRLGTEKLCEVVKGRVREER